VFEQIWKIGPIAAALVLIAACSSSSGGDSDDDASVGEVFVVDGLGGSDSTAGGDSVAGDTVGDTGPQDSVEELGRPDETEEVAEEIAEEVTEEVAEEVSEDVSEEVVEDVVQEVVEDVVVDADAEVVDDVTPDVVPDVVTDPVEDEVTEVVCGEVKERLEVVWDNVAECTRPTECFMRANPTCPFGNCYMFYNGAADLGLLYELESVYETNCAGGALCSCVLPTEVACVGGQCDICPRCPACPAGSDCILDACNCPIEVESFCEQGFNFVRNGVDDVRVCTTDDDCTVIQALNGGGWGPVPMECWFAHNRRASLAHINGFIEQLLERECMGLSICRFTDPPEVHCSLSVSSRFGTCQVGARE